MPVVLVGFRGDKGLRWGSGDVASWEWQGFSLGVEVEVILAVDECPREGL